jgi:hypothetical protein
LQLIAVGLVKFTTEIGSAGGGKLASDDLNAIAVNTPPELLKFTVGAVPSMAFRFKPSPSGRVV